MYVCNAFVYQFIILQLQAGNDAKAGDYLDSLDNDPVVGGLPNYKRVLIQFAACVLALTCIRMYLYSYNYLAAWLAHVYICTRDAVATYFTLCFSYTYTYTYIYVYVYRYRYIAKRAITESLCQLQNHYNIGTILHNLKLNGLLAVQHTEAQQNTRLLSTRRRRSFFCERTTLHIQHARITSTICTRQSRHPQQCSYHRHSMAVLHRDEAAAVAEAAAESPNTRIAHRHCHYY